jgi:hypothetical protein
MHLWLRFSPLPCGRKSLTLLAFCQVHDVWLQAGFFNAWTTSDILSKQQAIDKYFFLARGKSLWTVGHPSPASGYA